MATVSYNLNWSNINTKLEKAMDSDKIKEAAYKNAYPIFKRAYSKMLRAFNTHSITKEIEAGPEAENTSGTLGGYGNLFSFLGFRNGEEPTENIRRLLEDDVDFIQTVRRGKFYYFRVIMPSIADIEEATADDMEFEPGNSWATEVEKGVSGFSNYMKTQKEYDASRSHWGFQVKADLHDGEFEPKPYITKILADFKEELNKGF